MEAAKKAIWLKCLVNETGLKQNLVNVKCDSQIAICLVKNQVFHARMKHIEKRCQSLDSRLGQLMRNRG